jgi:hypothetical protein
MNRTLYPFQLLTEIPALNLTVLRVPVLLPRTPQFFDLDLAIAWDADRDERVFPIIRSLWYSGLLPPQTTFVGERKGGLTITLDSEYPEPLPGGSVPAYEAAVQELVNRSADPWTVHIATPSDWQLQISRLLKLGAWIRDDAHKADLELFVPSPGRFQS